MDKYGYIGIETLFNYCENSKDHAVTPNEFMRIKTGRHPDCPLDAFQDESSHSLIFGYPLEYLVAFAEACRRANVDESDLKTFANNCAFAYATMAEEYRQQVNHVIGAFMGNAGGTNESD